ncbi:MAG: DoxX family protein [Vulcanimicrobiaceae bacterium]
MSIIDTRPRDGTPVQRTLFATRRNAIDGVLLALRFALAIVVFPHGAQKLFGWFGGYGFAGTLGFFTGTMHLPAFLGVLAILAEAIGSILVFFGFFTRLGALAIATNMIVAVTLVHAHNGFFMNWTGQQKGEGVEYFVYAIVIALTLAVVGAGHYSVDARLAVPRD